jgi:hypothetical protein
VWYFRTVPTVWYFRTVPTVWYFRTVPTVWYFRTVPTVWYFRIVPTVWYFRTVPTVWYFRTVPTVWYFRTVSTVWYFRTVPTVWHLFDYCFISRHDTPVLEHNRPNQSLSNKKNIDKYMYLSTNKNIPFIENCRNRIQHFTEQNYTLRCVNLSLY